MDGQFILLVVCSTAGEELINKVALQNRQAGRDREEIRLDDLQEAIAQAVYSHNTSRSHFLFKHSALSLLHVKLLLSRSVQFSS